MKLRGYRQHRATGEVWAVESEDNVDVGCVGPISERDADARLLDFFAYQSMGLFPYRVQDFVRLDLCPICSLAILGTAPVERLNGNMAHASCMATRTTSALTSRSKTPRDAGSKTSPASRRLVTTREMATTTCSG